MKGPLVFFVSLAAVAAIGVAVVLPAFKEKQKLLADQGGPAGAAQGPGVSGERVNGAISDLRGALGADPDGWSESPADRGAALAGALGATVESGRGDSVVLLMDWNGLPRLMIALAEPVGPTLETLSAAPTENAEQCRVTLRFGALPGAPGGR